MNIKAFIVFFALFFFSGCHHYYADKSVFLEIRNLKAEVIRYDELLLANNIILLDDYMILQNGADKVDCFYYVYSYPDIKFLYSFALCGRGADEYMMPSIIKNVSGNRLEFKDHFRDIIAEYIVADSCAYLIDTTYFKSPDERFFWEINRLSDSLVLTKHQSHNDGNTELWDINKGSCLDVVNNTFSHLKKNMGKEYFSIYDDYMLSCNGNKFAIAYYMLDRLELGQIKEGKIQKNCFIGENTVPDFYRYGYNEKKDFNIDRNIIYYENLYVTNEAVYALYSNKRLDVTEREHSNIIEKYSWSGDPLMRYELDYPLAYFVVDERTHSIYGINPSIDNVILKYDISDMPLQ